MSTDQFDLMVYDLYCMDVQLPPLYGKRLKEFKQVSYSQWAVEELRNFVAKKFYPRTSGSMKEFCEYITEFADMSFQFASKNSETNVMFQIATDTAADILDLLESLK